jgi:hypothetical protein
MRRLLILVPAAIVVLLWVMLSGPAVSSDGVYTVPATPLTSTQSTVPSTGPCALAPEASDYVSSCLSLLAKPDGEAKVGECNDIDAKAQNDYAFQEELNYEDWNLGECYSAMLG